MKRKIIILSVVLLLLTTSLVSAQEERFHLLLSDDDCGIFYLDKESSREVLNTTTGKVEEFDVWFKIVYPEKAKKVLIDIHPKYKNVEYSLSHEKIRLKDRSTKLMEIYYYDNTGKVINQVMFPIDKQQWETIVPESNGEQIYKRVLSYFMAKTIKESK